ncbi:hypothetical protein ACQ4PT_029946 [Festuca glaucescens]
MITRKLRHYFSEHPIIVVNEAPLSNILNNPEATGRVSLWGIELSPWDITYEKRKAIKSQVLPDFAAEWLELQNAGPPDLSSAWTMYFDGSKRIEGAGAGVVLVSPQGDKMRYVLRMSFLNASNNEAEYEALLHGMRMAKACGATRLKKFGDSNLVAQQVMNQCDAISDNMATYRDAYNTLEASFYGCEVSHISRGSNEEADNLANIGSQCLQIPPGVFWEEISERSIKVKKPTDIVESKNHKGAKPQLDSGAAPSSEPTLAAPDEDEEPEEVMMIETTWMQPYLVYMLNKELPENPIEARRIARRSKAFTVVKGALYKRSISGVLQRCVTPDEGKAILKDVHEVDKFNKWVEAMPVTTQDTTAAVNFIKSIVFRFGVPNSIITDNSSNFTSNEFGSYCEELGIQLNFASAAHPQTNGQVEKANGLICNGLKKRLLAPLERAKSAWVEELPSVLWSLRTTPNAATQETPLFLVHGAEAVLLVEITHEAPRVSDYEEVASTKALEDDVDALDEARDVTLARSTAYQKNLRNYHNRRLRPRSFNVGDLVLRLKQDSHNKLESPWERPYIVTEVIPGGAYRLQDKKSGAAVANPWNVAQLRRFYA